MPLRIVFMGTAELACASLKALLESPEFEVAAVVTQPDRPKGRDLKLQPSAVKQSAAGLGIPILQPERARQAEFFAQLIALRPDLIVVAAYGQILSQAILDLPRLGCLNVHTSLLPKYRGAAPIQWAILNDECETGVTIMKMDAGLDTGDILRAEATPINPQDDAASLHDRLAVMGARLLVSTIMDFAAGCIVSQPQIESQSSYARKISKEDGCIDWTQPARTIWNRVRAFTPWPSAFTFLPDEPRRRLLKIFHVMVDENCHGLPGTILQAGPTGLLVACGQGSLRLEQLQLEGSRRMSATELLRGHPLLPGTKIG